MITLTTPTQVTASGLLSAGVTSETDASAAVASFTVDFLAGAVTFQLVLGTVSGQTINVGVYPPRISVTVNLATGAWTSTNGLSGTIVPASLTNVIAQFASDRNLMETFSCGASGILPGTQTAWASTSI